EFMVDALIALLLKAKQEEQDRSQQLLRVPLDGILGDVKSQGPKSSDNWIERFGTTAERARKVIDLDDLCSVAEDQLPRRGGRLRITEDPGMLMRCIRSHPHYSVGILDVHVFSRTEGEGAGSAVR